MRYVEPQSVDGVLDALAEHGDAAKVITGGQSLLILMRDRLVGPEVLFGLTSSDAPSAELPRAAGEAAAAQSAPLTDVDGTRATSAG